MLNIGVVGTGDVAWHHVECLRRWVPACNVVGVAGRSLERTTMFAQQIGEGVVAYPSDVDLVSDPRIDAVIVATPGSAHEGSVIHALKARKPVLCEKPLSTTSAACQRILLHEAEAGRRLVQVGFMRRYDPAFVDLRQALDSGRIGSPLLFHSVHRNPATGANFGFDMVFNDVLVHDVDVARWLFGDEVGSVTVHRVRTPVDGRDGFIAPLLVVCEMRNGAVADVEISVNAGYGYDIRAEVVGDRGVVELAETARVHLKAEGAVHGSIAADWRERFAPAFSRELREWVEAASAGTATGPSAWDGYMAAYIGEGALQSFETGERVVLESRIPPPMYA